MRALVLTLVLLFATAASALAQTAPQMVLQVGHAGRVQGLAFSPDGRLLASVSADGTLKLWDTHAHALLGDVRAQQGALRAVVFSPDSRLVATAGSDGTVKLWDGATLGLARTETVGDGPVNALAVSPDGRMVAAATWRPEEHVIQIYDLATGAARPPLVAPGGEPRSLAFSPDSRLLAVGVAGQADGENEVELWDTQFGTCARVLRSKRRSAEAVAWTPDGRYLAAATIDGTVELWESETTVWLGSLAAGNGALHALSFAPQGRTFAVGGDAGGRIFSGQSPQAELRTGPGGIQAIAWSPDGTVIAGGTGDGAIVFWSPFGGAVAAFPARDRWDWVPAFMPDGSLTVCGHRVGAEAPAAAWWDSSSMGLRTIVPGSASAVFAGPQSRSTAVTATAVSPRNRLVATGSANGAVGLWNGADGTLLRAIPAMRPQIGMLALAFDPGGARLAGGTADGLVAVWDMQSGAAQRPFTGHTGPVQAVAFSSDATMLASGSQDRTVRLWDARSGALLLRLDAGLAVNAVAFSPDRAQLAAAVGEPGHEGHALVWTLRGGSTPRVMSGFAAEATCVAFSSNGTALAVGGADATARLFDARSGALLRTFEGHNGALEGVAVSADATLLATGARDGTVRLFDLRDGSLLLTWTTGSTLSAAERQWIAFDPQGYFLGSQNAASLVRWRNGLEADATERYLHIFFRPDVIERILRRGP